MSKEARVRGARLKIALVALIFFGPLALAWALYYGLPDTPASERTNAGELLDPVRPVPQQLLAADESVLREQWTLLTVAPDGCGETCRARLADTRQVRALMHRRSTRVQRVLVTGDTDDAVLTESGHPDLRVVPAGSGLADFFGEPGEAARGTGVIHIVDPLGNWVLYYPPDTAPDAVFKDLKHLLKLSHVG